MAKFSKHGRRCDTCGKFSNNKQGEYTRKDGTAGYIWPDQDTDGNVVSDKEFCEECLEKEQPKCESVN